MASISRAIQNCLSRAAARSKVRQLEEIIGGLPEEAFGGALSQIHDLVAKRLCVMETS